MGPLLNPLRAQIRALPIDASFKLFTINNFLLRTESLAGQLLSPLQITDFLSFQEAIKIRQEETLQAASRDLPAKEEDEGGEVLPSDGEVTAWLIRGLKRPCLDGHRSFNTLASQSSSLENGTIN